MYKLCDTYSISMKLLLYLSTTSAGFPSPADDLVDRQLNLYAHLIPHPATTFITRVQGESMNGAGIFDSDLLIVDRSLEPRDGDIIIATVYGDLSVRRFRTQGTRVWLESAHPSYSPIELFDPEDSGIWGVVTYSIHSFR